MRARLEIKCLKKLTVEKLSPHERKYDSPLTKASGLHVSEYDYFMALAVP